MRNLIIIILIIASNFSFGQPNPQLGYPKRIKAITEQLKTDSLNYELIWEKLEMEVNLLGGLGAHDEIFYPKNDESVRKANIKEHFFNELNTDFNKIYNNLIKVKKYDIVEEGDFYLNRIWFYFNVNKIDKAIEDAKYLRDSASYSRYWERGDMYNNWALYSLFNLYVINNQYKEALGAIDTMLEKKKRENSVVYFSGHGSFLSYRDKISLFEHFNEKDKIIPFLKENCREHFNWYFENAKQNNYSTIASKQQSFELLKLINNYMEKYEDRELLKYEKILKQLCNDNFETISPDISDIKLKSIVSEIK